MQIGLQIKGFGMEPALRFPVEVEGVLLLGRSSGTAAGQ